MIYDEISNLKKYSAIHPLFKKVIEFVNSKNLKELENGKIELGDNVIAIVDEYETGNIQNKFIECHRKFIDIQLVVSGIEKIGFCNRKYCKVTMEYSEENDFEKVEGDLDFLTLRAKEFAIFYPEDAHMPGVAYNNNNIDKVKKIVFKIPV